MSAQLIKKISAVTIGTTETVLFDWFDTSELSDMKLFIENTGSNAITSVSEQRSAEITYGFGDDIAAGGTALLELQDSSAKTKITAIADTASTTVNAWLIAESSAALLCTLSDVKDRLGIDVNDSDHAKLIERIISGLGPVFDNYTLITDTSTAAKSAYFSAPIPTGTRPRMAFRSSIEAAMSLSISRLQTARRPCLLISARRPSSRPASSIKGKMTSASHQPASTAAR